MLSSTLMVATASLLLAASAQGQTMYKCQNSGRTEYSDRPCNIGVEMKRMAPDGGPTPEDRARAQARITRGLVDAESRERLAAQARQRNAGSPQSPLTSGDGTAPSNARENNEKVMVHNRSGFDFKTRGQIRAEAEARASGRPPPATGAAWERERVLSHSPSGWDQTTRREQVLQEAAREQRRRETAATAAQSPATFTDQYGRTWINNGATAFNPATGRTCVNAGRTLVGCN